MNALPECRFTPAEYLELETRADYRSQYVSGEIFAMVGTQPVHNEISGNILFALGMGLRGRPCRTYF